MLYISHKKSDKGNIAPKQADNPCPIISIKKKQDQIDAIMSKELKGKDFGTLGRDYLFFVG